MPGRNPERYQRGLSGLRLRAIVDRGKGAKEVLVWEQGTAIDRGPLWVSEKQVSGFYFHLDKHVTLLEPTHEERIETMAAQKLKDTAPDRTWVTYVYNEKGEWLGLFETTDTAKAWVKSRPFEITTTKPVKGMKP